MKLDVIIPSYKSKVLTALCVRSFENYKGKYDMNYIVVENSDDSSYKSDIESLAENVTWVQNPIEYMPHQPFYASKANAIGIETGLKYVKEEYVLICHNDVAAVRHN